MAQQNPPGGFGSNDPASASRARREDPLPPLHRVRAAW